MTGPWTLLNEVARQSVEDITVRYDTYHPELILKFAELLRILQEEPNRRNQRRRVEELVHAFGKSVSEKSGSTYEA